MTCPGQGFARLTVGFFHVKETTALEAENRYGKAFYSSSSRMQAVKALAPKIKFIDWMQANWAYNVFDTDWLWALHDTENPYWEQNRNIVAHAWERWSKERDGVWLQIAIRRVHPGDPIAADILSAAQTYLSLPLDEKLVDRETPEYRAWLYSLWENSIRLYLGRGNTTQALDLISNQPNAQNLLMPRYGSQSSEHARSLEKVLRWLVYCGTGEEARSALAMILKPYPGGFKKWRSLLATSPTEANAAGMVVPWYGSGDEVWTNDASTWQAMLNDMSTEALHEMASNASLHLPYRALISRTVLMRALLLGSSNDVVDKYAALAAKLNPYMRENILAGVASHDKNGYISFLLKMPRFRPAVFLEYANDIEGATGQLKKDAQAFDAIDTYDHNDNNWWCGFDPGVMQERVFKAARIAPSPGRLFSNTKIEAEINPYLVKQQKLLAMHPYRALVDEKEIEALQAIPSGPQYLSEAVIARERADTRELGAEERNARAADLSRAVRTTRYGCNRDGSHAEYSKEAFKLLHGRYDDTSWAKATPYWFK